MTDQGRRVKSDLTKQGWEDAEFPILCENCLGDNPYVRMSREQFGGSCKVCERPFSVFRWKPGAKARYKSTVTCQLCAKLKNTCQCCILDLQYGLPVEVRDKVMAQAAAAAASASGGGSALALAGAAGAAAVPGSDVNRQYALAQAEAAMAGGGAVVPYSGAAGLAPGAHEALLRMGRSTPYYARNAPKLCSFFARGECARGASCPYRHEMPKDKDDPLSKQNYKDRYYGTDDPVAAKLMRRATERAEAGGGGGAGGATAPEASDPTATTVWLGGVEDGRPSTEEIRSALYAYGDIRSVFAPPGKGCAFVTYATHEQAAAAIARTGGALSLGVPPALQLLRVSWAKKAAGGDRESRLHGAAADPRAALMPYPPQAPPQQQPQQQYSTAAGAGPSAFPPTAAAAAAPGADGVAPWASAVVGAGGWPAPQPPQWQGGGGYGAGGGAPGPYPGYAPPPPGYGGGFAPHGGGGGGGGSGPIRGGGGRHERAAAAAPHYPSMSGAQAGAPG